MYRFYSDCINWPRHDVQALSDMADEALDITRKTFLKHIDTSELAQMADNLGYDQHHTQGLTMAADYHVSYHRSTLNGKRCYYFCHSAIEHVFTKGATP